MAGWLEWTRAEAFQTLSPSDPTLLEGEPWSSFGGQVFIVAQRAISAVLAVYGPRDILWLDDHSDDVDFGEFIRREKLKEWLPSRAEDFARLLVGTRLNYLGSPMLLEAPADIPAYADSDKSDYQKAGMEETLQIVLESERRLAEASDKVARARVASLPGDRFELECTVWTRIMGRLILLNVLVDPDGECHVTGEEIARFVGKGYVPR